MKLFAFWPSGHGPFSFFVMASSEQEARESIQKWINENSEHDYETREFPIGYQHAVFEAGEVAVNSNS